MALLQALLTTCPPSPTLTTFGKPRVAGKFVIYDFIQTLPENAGRDSLETLRALVVRATKSFEIQKLARASYACMYKNL